MAPTRSHLLRNIAVFLLLLLASPAMSQDTTLYIQSTEDFEIDGEGNHAAWSKTEWVTLTLQHGPAEKLLTQAKVLYSETGVYFLVQCEDEKLTATLTEDFADLYKEDVVEIFLWTDEAQPLYFEYELSPLNYELPIIIPNQRVPFSVGGPGTMKASDSPVTLLRYRVVRKKAWRKLVVGRLSFSFPTRC